MTTLTTIVEALMQQANGHSAIQNHTQSNDQNQSSTATASQPVLGLGTRHDHVTHNDPAHIDRTVVNQLIDSVLSGLAGGNMHEHAFAQPERQASFLLRLIAIVLQWIRQQGGLTMALHTLRQAGLEAQVASWTRPGVNDRITPDLLDDLFAQADVDDLAQQFGVRSSTVYTGLAMVLPQLIDILTKDNDQDLSQADIEINNGLTRLHHL